MEEKRKITKEERKMKLLGEEKMSKVLLEMGIPTMIGLMVSALYNVVDAYWVGRLGTLATAAVSVVYPLGTVSMMIGLLFGSGANSVIARLLGQNRDEEVKHYSSTAVYTAMGTISIINVGMLMMVDPILIALGTRESCMDMAKEYGIIFIFGLFFNVLNMCMNNMIVAEGNSFKSMFAMLVGGAANLILDPLLILNFHMGVRGAAIATMISRMISAALYLQYVMSKKSRLSLHPGQVRLDKEHLTNIIKIGLPISLFQLITGMSGVIVNNLAYSYGEDTQAALGIINRIMFLETNILYGFFKGYSPVVGYNFGAGKMERVKEATRLAVLWSTSFTMIIGLVIIALRSDLIRIFNKDSAQVLAIGTFGLAVYAFSYVTYGYQIITGNFFLAIGEAKRGGMLSLGKGVLYCFFLLLMERIDGIRGLICAQLVTDLTATVITALVYRNYQITGKRISFDCKNIILDKR